MGKVTEGGAQKRRLTTKQRKRLSKLLEQKEKKSKRVSLLQSLAQNQLPEGEMKLMQSSAKLGTAKSATLEQLTTQLPEASTVATLESFMPRRKRKKRVPRAAKKKVAKPSVTVASSSSSDSESEEEEEDVESSEDEEAGSEQEHAAGGSEAADPTGDGFQPSQPLPVEKCGKAGAAAGAPSDGSLPAKGAGKADVAVPNKPVTFVPLKRDPTIQAARLQLPILAEEQVIMEAINENSIVIIAGETGSGKTTQVPQFLYEAGYTKPTENGKLRRIGVTEPRRVAAVSMAKRVAEEMGLTEKEVSYQIRYEGTASSDTEIKFMTDGVLLKEIENDFLLNSYTAVIVDEAHERSVYTDILLGMLSRILPIRSKRGQPLKLIVMSATLRVEDFTDNRFLFLSPPPVIKVESRQFPVSVHFSKRTPNDDQYMHEALRKVCKIHRQLPEGGILVFVTGQQEVNWLCSRLRRMFPATTTAQASDGDGPGCKQKLLRKINLDDIPAEPTFDAHDLEDGVEEDRNAGDDAGDSEAASSDSDLSEDDTEMSTAAHDQQLPMRVLPLYALLSPERQAEVFAPAPEGVRMCVVATNVAETSLTIPNTKYIVDTGKVKRRYYDKVTGASTFQVGWTSAASADQRAGRAGRTGPGHCYRLFSAAVFGNEFEKFSPPEITRRPVDDLYLQLKSMNIIKVENFPFPTPPPVDSLKVADQLLLSLGALEEKPLKGGKGTATDITPLGTIMSSYPVSPRFSKMLTMVKVRSLLPYTIAMVAVLSVQDILVGPAFSADDEENDEETKKTREEFTKRLITKWGIAGQQGLLGDVLLMLKVVCAAEANGCTDRYCQQNGIRRKAVIEVRRLRKQLTGAVNAKLGGEHIALDPKMLPPSAKEVILLRQALLTGLGDHTARKVDTTDMPGADKKRLRYAYQCINMEEPVYLPSSSAIKFLKAVPQFVVFREIIESTKPFMQCVVGVESAWLPRYAGFYCTLSDPLEIPPPSFDPSKGIVKCHRTATFGPQAWPVAAQALPFPTGWEKYKWFAKFLLEGAVVPKLERFAEHLLFKPSTILRPWGPKLHSWIQNILKALASVEVDSRQSLMDAWKKSPSYLLKEYKAWFPSKHHPEIALLWPPVAKD